MIGKYVKTESECSVAKRSRKSLHISDNTSRDISAFLDVLDTTSIIIPDKRPNTAIKDLENYIKSVYAVPNPECFLMNGEEYSGDRCLHELTREKYLYVPFQSALDVEVRFFSLRKGEALVESLRSMDTDQVEAVKQDVIGEIKYGVNVINFYKRKIKNTQNNGALSAFIPQILRGNTCDDANEEKIDELMRHRYKSTPINIKQNIFQFKQMIESELMVNLDKVDVFDLYKFHKLPEQLPLSTFITMANDYTDFIISFRFKQMPKINLICIVINQVTPIHLPNDDKPEIPILVPLTASPPKELLLPSLDQLRIADKEQWVILDTFSHGCKIEDPKDWTALELGLWLNYIRTSFNIIPKDRETHQLLLRGEFYNILVDKSNLLSSFKPNCKDAHELILSRFIRHCELLLKYKLFYQFNQYVLKKLHRVNTSQKSTPPPPKTKGPQGRSKARREDLVRKSGGRREIQLNSKNLMDTKLGQSLYSGKNSTSATTISQFQHRKWTFFLKCLVQPERATEVAWIDYEGVFRLVEQDSIAKMYGETCNKPDMTYDKLSRGLRYDRSGIIDKVDKNYCWKFTVPIEEILGLNVETVIRKMYKYYKKRNSNYPADLLLKESLAKKKTKPIGPMEILVRDPKEEEEEDRIVSISETDYHETYSRVGYMSTDKRINFWTTPEHISQEKFQKRLMQGRLVHSVMPNEVEFISLTSLNNNKFILENQSWMKSDFKVSPKIKEDPLLADMSSRNRNDSLNFDYHYQTVAAEIAAPEVEEELVIDCLFDQEHMNCLE